MRQHLLKIAESEFQEFFGDSQKGHDHTLVLIQYMHTMGMLDLTGRSSSTAIDVDEEAGDNHTDSDDEMYLNVSIFKYLFGCTTILLNSSL